MKDGIGLLMLGSPKGPGASAKEPPERMYAKEAFSAIKDDDESGFVEAFVSAVRACSKKSEEAEYEDADDEA